MAGIWRKKSWLRRWLRGDNYPGQAEDRPPRIRTQFSSTVFSGQPTDWIEYLGVPSENRYDGRCRIRVEWRPDEKRIEFHSESDASVWLANGLNLALSHARRMASEKPFVVDLLDSLLFDNASNHGTSILLRSSTHLPSEATRESEPPGRSENPHTYIVLREALLDYIAKQGQSFGKDVSDDETLGLFWPALRRVIAQLSFPSFPRDRFAERIRQTARLSVVSVNLLFEGRSGGRLRPNKSGRLYQRYIARRDDVPLDQLDDRHPYFRYLNEMSFARREERYKAYQEDVAILTREYLDERYLRLSIASVMPEVSSTMAPMPYLWDGPDVSTPLPRVGRYGILDDEDVEAWQKLEQPLDEMGYTLLRQLGMGEFGRVYEAINQASVHMPQRVAIKVDRYRKGQKKQAIQAAEVAMQIGKDLAKSPHVIRIYDAGKIRKHKYTFHVLQLIDGDTLDNLLGITGNEHSSVLHPGLAGSSSATPQAEFARAMRGSKGEGWRRRALMPPFDDPLSLAETLDLVKSTLLWVEEIHGLGYAINDLKNGNLMVSRRGQLKGIDMDTYSAVETPTDRTVDFLFLGVTLLYILLYGRRDVTITHDEIRRTNLRDKDALRQVFAERWPIEDVAVESEGRVEKPEVIELLAELLSRCRNKDYVDAPDRFTEDIDRLIALRRSIRCDELVFD